ncbi:MAG: PadR family transcriptional regulator [Inquilinus sp.]|nr:PadR family transcriptional regulator [Inquilinus sp.]
MDVKTLCLGVLSRRDCSGYEIRKQFEEGPFAHFQDAGFGSIYPALKKLTESGLVNCRAEEQDSRPDKKVYAITQKGRQALFDAVNQQPAADKLRSDFMFMLFFADLLAPAAIDRMIAQRSAHHAKLLNRLEGCDRVLPAGERFVLNYGIAIHRAALAYFEDHGHELVGALLQKDVAE